jgi:cell division protein FtsI/penicillin-binding protein 2
VLAADATMAAPALVRLADGGLRFDANPRLLAAARQYLRRGDIVDRNGVILATSDPAAVGKQAAALSRLGVDADSACRLGRARCYPFGGRLFHVLGDANTELDWRASNTSFVERDEAVRLQGFDDRSRIVTVQTAGAPVRVVRESYEELVPLARHKYRPGHSIVRELRDKERDVRLTIDARLQVRVADLLQRGVEDAGSSRGAAAVMDARTGEILAAVSYPWPVDDAPDPMAREARLDRVRYGVYPPGSTFKLVTAAATLALKPELASSRHMCVLLPDGRVGARIPGEAPVRDDTLDTHPHGRIGLDEALRVSCNAYFAQLARELGPEPILAMASKFDIDTARPNTVARLREQLAYAGFGQGETLTTPWRLLGVTGSIAAGGLRAPAHLVLEPAPAVDAARVFPASAAARLARDMAAAVSSGTGRAVAGVRPSIAGKTGTAEVEGAPSHSWFTGFAPASGGGRRLAFVVLVEHGGYGGRAAAPIAGRIIQAARELQLFAGDGE